MSEDERPWGFVLEKGGDVETVTIARTSVPGFDMDLCVADVSGDVCLVRLTRDQAEKIGHALLQAARRVPRR